MKNEKEWNAKILALTMKVRTENPELSKYHLEMPITITDLTNPEINNKALQEYYNSLKTLLDVYDANQ